jgi:hypothetical protein
VPHMVGSRIDRSRAMYRNATRHHCRRGVPIVVAA